MVGAEEPVVALQTACCAERAVFLTAAHINRSVAVKPNRQLARVPVASGVRTIGGSSIRNTEMSRSTNLAFNQPSFVSIHVWLHTRRAHISGSGAGRAVGLEGPRSTRLTTGL